jgi:DNA-binding transcriptional ArsR family regulator
VARSSTAADVFHAIADANRRALLDTVIRGEASVGTLASSVGLSYSAASQHLAILHEVGLVTRRKDGRQRIYGLNPRPLRIVHAWTTRYEQFWHGRLDRLHKVLGEKR